MKKLITFVLFFAVVSLSMAQVSGTKTIPGDYATITAAISDITTNGLSGATILELQSSYTSGTETFPIKIGTYVGNSFTLTIQPDTLATGLAITNTNIDSTSAIELNGARNVIIDGRPGGFGSSKELKIESSNAAAPALLFINDASSNIVKYCELKASNTNTGRAVVLFWSGIETGNDNNTIDYCNINGNSASAQCVYSLGKTTFTTSSDTMNSGNTISNSNIYDFYLGNTLTSVTYGIRIHTNNTNWTISNNSVYQTAARSYAATNTLTVGISIEAGTGNNFTISGNYIGGSQANAGGTAWTVSSGFASWRGIQTTVGTTTPSNVQGNTITNIDITTAFNSSGSSMFIANFLNGGSVNFGTTTGNVLGSDVSTSAVKILFSAATVNIPLVIGVFPVTSSAATINISNNKIGGILVDLNNATTRVGFYAISVGGTGNVTISNNLIGSLSTANSIEVKNSTSATQFNLRGINVGFTAGFGAATFTGNTIANLSYTSSSNSGQATVNGIFMSTGTNNISQNTVRDLKCDGLRTSSGSTASLIAINYVAAAAPNNQIISRNNVYNLQTSNPTLGVEGYGIFFEVPLSTGNLIEKNNVYNITTTSSNTNANITGIYNNSGVTTIANNMVSLGSGITNALNLTGIRKGGTAVNGNLYYNSVLISGTGVGVAGTTWSYAFRRSGSGTDTLKNNIFMTKRENASGNTQRHYAIVLAGQAGVTSDNNLIYASGLGTILGSASNGTTNTVNLTAWQDTTLLDLNSASVDVQFINDVSDLHLTGSSLGNGNLACLPIATVTTDIDGDTRNASYPYKGADEITSGTFTPKLNITALIEGFTNFATGKMIPDTLTVELRNTSPGYTLVDQAKVFVDSSGYATGSFTLATNGTPYYVVVKHRNSIETWSDTSGKSFSAYSMNYDFTNNSGKAYGANMIQKNTKWCIFGGDMTSSTPGVKDGLVDGSDLAAIDNDNTNFVTGYVDTDLTGEQIVDGSDLAIVDNNNTAFVGKVVPPGALTAKRTKQPITEKENK